MIEKNRNIYYFGFQIGNPLILHEKLYDTYENLSDAIESVFPMETEKLIMIWNGIYVPICYKYDLSVIIDTILDFFPDFLELNTDQMHINFGSDTFMVEWEINFRELDIIILSKWKNVINPDVKSILNNSTNSKLVYNKTKFIKKWELLIDFIYNILKNIRIKQKSELEKLKYIRNSIHSFLPLD